MAVHRADGAYPSPVCSSELEQAEAKVDVPRTSGHMHQGTDVVVVRALAARVLRLKACVGWRTASIDGDGLEQRRGAAERAHAARALGVSRSDARDGLRAHRGGSTRSAARQLSFVSVTLEWSYGDAERCQRTAGGAVSMFDRPLATGRRAPLEPPGIERTCVTGVAVGSLGVARPGQ